MTGEVVKFNSSQIYNEDFAERYRFISDLISVITLILATLFLTIVIRKTPKPMKRFKFYLICYLDSCIIFQIFIFLNPIIILHPYYYLYSPGISKFFPPNIRLMLYSFVFVGLFSSIDCVISMLWERYYALKGETESKISLYIFGFLTALNICTLLTCFLAALIKPLYNFGFIPPENIVSYISQKNIYGLEMVINVETIIIPRESNFFHIPWGFLVVCLLSFVRVPLFLICALLGYKTSKIMQSQMQLSVGSQKLNEMLRRVIYIQSSGYIFFCGIPMCIVSLAFLIIKEPIYFISYFLSVVYCVEIYDIVLFALIIKPYRKAILDPFNYVKNGIFQSSVIIPISTPLTTIIIKSIKDVSKVQ